MLAIQKAIEKRIGQEANDKEFLFLRETQDGENNKEYSFYAKVLPGQTRIFIDKKSFKTEQDYASIEGRSLIVKAFGIEFDKVSICPKLVSVKPKLVYVIAEIAIQDDLQDWDIGSIVESEEETEED